MCGIAFLYDSRLDAAQLKAKARLSLDRMQLRGPDDDGLSIVGSCAIGHVRLSVIDLQQSKQPISDVTGRYHLSFNGEIYNYKTLRSDLLSRWDFMTQGDTEVLLAGLVIEGEKFLDKMEGMWSFAFWDSQESELLVSRDRFGEKPLYYQSNGRSFSCASELPALESLSESNWHEDMRSTYDYFSYGFYLPGYTAYKAVFEILPGHLMKWKPGAEPRQYRYWKFSTSGIAGVSGREARSEHLRALLDNSVKLRMTADVEVGAFLSGGIDSSIIAATASEYGLQRTFTLAFDESSFDESGDAAQLAQWLKLDNSTTKIRRFTPDILLQLIKRRIGQPFIDSSLLPSSEIAKFASKQVKVVLSGDGADELFSGYQRYLGRALLRWYTSLPKALRRTAEKIITSFPEPQHHHSASFFKKAHLFVNTSKEGLHPYIAPRIFSTSETRSILGGNIEFGHQPDISHLVNDPEELKQMMIHDTLIYLPQDILRKVDAATMDSSLEARCPFLDRKVAEFAINQGTEAHRGVYKGKKILRDSYVSKLPHQIFKRRKHGFAMPVGNWFLGPCAQQLEQMLGRDNHVLDRQFVKKLLAEHGDRRDHGHALWGVYTYLNWKNNQFNMDARD